MFDYISIKGIETNNLKGIDIRIAKNDINLIIGPSGSGKSSLAYDTVAQIGNHELGCMFDSINEPEYKVASYENMIVTIPLKQQNYNNNVRSTIGTYFSLNSCLGKIFSSVLGLPYDLFVLNKSDNACPMCYGLGYSKKLDNQKIIDYNKTIIEVPIRCWNRSKDFYRKILELFCQDEKIDINARFKDLTDSQKKKLLYGESENKYKIKYKITNHYSTRTTKYYGPMTGIPMLKNFSPNSDFFSERNCDFCGGEKFDNAHRNYKICNYSIGEILLMPFERITDWAAEVKRKYDSSGIDFSLNQIKAFAEKATELNLGHLFMNRNIPSLSGGEFQRLRLIQVFVSQLNDLLIVLDEPLAGLSPDEKRIVYKNIKKLVKKHTLLIVDHHKEFLNDAKIIIALGKGGGINGGNRIDVNEYLLKQDKDYKITPLSIEEYIDVKIRNEVYCYKGVDLKIAKNRMNIVTGASGIGKTTLLKEYFPQVFDKYLYVNQKPINGKMHTVVATNLNIYNKIIELYSKKFNKEKSFFSNMKNSKGACPKCFGTGIITYGKESQSQIRTTCKDCKGTGFGAKLSKYKIDNYSILDIWDMTIDEAVLFFKNNKQIHQVLERAQQVLLGHIKIGEKTHNLSGGENIRIKLIKAINSNSEVFGIDEPFRGLNNEEIFMVSELLNSIIQSGKTVIVADHEEGSFKYFSKRIILQNKKDILTE
jgi:excinuclease UvrABC ATPase subunit